MLTMLRFAVLFFALGCVAAVYAAGDPAAGAQKNRMCQGCHGIPGYRYAYPDYRVPRLGGQHAQYIVNALKEYQSKARSNPTMQAIAADLSDQDMQDLAAYYSQKPEKAAGTPAGGTKP
jgi:cytochrome c553